MTPTIVFVRETTLLTDAMVEAYVAAQQIQITRDFAPIWGIDAKCIIVLTGQPIPTDAWQVLLLNHTDQAGALGYHETVTPNGLPRAKPFIADALADGVAWSVTCSHEVLEMLADPEINKVIDAVQDGATYEYAWEVCDAPEDDSFSYPINGFHMSAFVTPSWFNTTGAPPFVFPASVPITRPFALAEGGYIGVREVAPQATGWTQRFAMGEPGRRALNKTPTSRTMRRMLANRASEI